MNSLQPVRENNYPGKVLLIDGISGSGKTLLMKLVDCYQKNSAPAFNFTLEHICISHYRGEINEETAKVLARLILDQQRFDHSISREINLRVRDLSSVLKSSKKSQYLMNLVREDSVRNSNQHMLKFPNLCLVTHQLNDATRILSSNWKSDFLEIVSVRHPYYLLEHWNSYMSTLGSNPRDFTFWIDYKGENIPWFINDYVDLYYESDSRNRAALCIIEILSQTLKKMESLPEKSVVIPFENFVLSPWGFVEEIQDKMSLEPSQLVKSVLKRERVPRTHINSGKQLPVYMRYGSGALDSRLSMKEDFSSLEETSKKSLTPEIFLKFKALSEQYRDVFGSWY